MTTGDVSRARGSRVAGIAAVAVLAAALVAAAGARATAPAISYPDFSSLAGLKLNGDAVQAGTALRLAPNVPLQHGSVWAQAPIDTSQSFESRFEADVHDGSYQPADGMTFTLQSLGLSALGDNGGGHGYGGFVSPIPQSVAVDVSIFPQIMNGTTERFGVFTNGNLFAPLATAQSPALLYGSPFWVWVDYDAAAHSLQVFSSQTSTKPATPLLSTSVDLGAAVGPTAYAGFTAGTGGLDADFDLRSWTLEGTADTTPPTVTCSATPSVLWPPNNKLVSISTTVSVADSDSGPAGFTLASVTSNEGDAASESKDWTLGSADTAGQLRAARNGSGTGRVYTLTYVGSDAAGNKASCAATVTVPHDQGH